MGSFVALEVFRCVCDYRRMSTPFWVAIIKTLIVGFMGWAKARKARMDAEALLSGALHGGDATEEPRWGGELIPQKAQLTSNVRPLNNELA